jgi:predicted acetyltransferase
MRQRLWVSAWVVLAALTGVTGTAAFAWGQPAHAGAQHLVCGIVHKVNGAKFALETRDGKVVQVDASAAIKAERSAALYEGLAVSAAGKLNKSGALQAETVIRIKSSRALWPEDR